MKLIDVLKPEYIKIPLVSQTKEEAIRELVDLLAQHQLFQDVDAVFQAVLDREKIMTTGVGRGVAIPHCKKAECSKFAIALGIRPEGVDFKSIDNQPAKVIFLLIGPDNNPGMHIRLLSRISRLISKDSLRDALLTSSSADKAYLILKNEEEKYFEIAP